MQTATLIETPFVRYEDAVTRSVFGEPNLLVPKKYPLATGTVVAPIETKTLEGRLEALCEADKEDPILKDYEPKTSLGEAILKLRRLYLESGGKLLEWDEIEDEVRMMRGGLREE